MSTSKLQRQVGQLLLVHLGQHTIRENTRPDWLVMPNGARLELDFYIEELETAIEVQGAQHYVYTPHFHKDYTDFQRQVERDEFKRARCAEMGTTLFETSTLQDAVDFILSRDGNAKIKHTARQSAKTSNAARLDEVYQEYIILRKEKRDLRARYKGLLRNNKKGAARKKRIKKLEERIRALAIELKTLKFVLRTFIGDEVFNE